jgi:hypothetical protein
MQISGGSSHRYYRCVANRKRGACANRLSVREDLTRSRVLDAVGRALATPEAAAYVRHRIAERAGALARNAGRELAERTARLDRVEERVRGLILMQAEGDRSAMVAEPGPTSKPRRIRSGRPFQSSEALRKHPSACPRRTSSPSASSSSAPSPTPRTSKGPEPRSTDTSRAARSPSRPTPAPTSPAGSSCRSCCWPTKQQRPPSAKREGVVHE